MTPEHERARAFWLAAMPPEKLTLARQALELRRVELAELAGAYELIDKMWMESGVPLTTPIRQQDGWQDGWSLLVDWVDRLRAEHNWPPVDRSDPYFFWRWPPSQKATWPHEVHAFSHIWNPEGGHSLRHAKIEKEGTLAVIKWWNAKL